QGGAGRLGWGDFYGARESFLLGSPIAGSQEEECSEGRAGEPAERGARPSGFGRGGLADEISSPCAASHRCRGEARTPFPIGRGRRFLFPRGLREADSGQSCDFAPRSTVPWGFPLPLPFAARLWRHAAPGGESAPALGGERLSPLGPGGIVDRHRP